MPRLANRNQPLGTGLEMKMPVASCYFLVPGWVEKQFEVSGKIRKSTRLLHNVVFTQQAGVPNFGVYALVFRPLCAVFCPALRALVDLLNRLFYTLSTNLITKTTVFKKTLIMEAA